MANSDIQVGVSFDMSSVKKGAAAVSNTIKSSLSAMQSVGSAALNGIKDLAVGVGAASTAAATAVATIGKASLDAYSDYEQLAGGVETLFKSSADIVSEYAKNAYETAGMSANEYMQTVTTFSASLISSLGGDTEAAAKQADVAITDMSDNANKMGTALESIQYAYAGFAKQNYTMLDNLKIGYGGTKAEMERLLADAEKISGVHYDISNFSDIVSAIHVIQDEIGITGTTAKEADNTLEGSFRALKAAWQNLLVGFADENQDVGVLIGKMVERAGIYLDNLIPRVEQIITSLIQNLPQMLSGLREVGARIMSSLTDAIARNGSTLSSTIAGIIKDAIYNLYNIIVQMAPVVVEAGRKLLSEVLQEIDLLLYNIDFTQILYTIFDAIVGAGKLVDEFIPYFFNMAIRVLNDVIAFLRTYDFSELISTIGSIAGTILNESVNLVSQAIPVAISIISQYINDILTGATEYLRNADFSEAVSAGIDWIVNVVNMIVNNLPEIISNAIQMITEMAGAALRSVDIIDILDAIGSIAGTIIDNLPEIFDAVIDMVYTIIEWAIDAIQTTDWEAVFTKLGEVLGTLLRKLGEALLEILYTQVQHAWEFITNIDWIGLGRSILEGIVNGLAGLGQELGKQLAQGALDGINMLKDLLGIHSPSRVMYAIGQNIGDGLVEGLSSRQRAVLSVTDQIAKDVSNALSIDGSLSAASISAAAFSGGYVVNNNVSQVYTVGDLDVTNNQAATTAIDSLCDAIQIYSIQKPLFA